MPLFGMKTILVYSFIFCYLSIISADVSVEDEQNWVQPHAWGDSENHEREKDKSKHKISENPEKVLEIHRRNEDIKAIELFYIKLVNYIFNESKMKIVDKKSNKLSRTIHLEISQDQLKSIKESLNNNNNIRRVDTIVFDVLKNSNDGIIFTTAEYVFSGTEKILYFFTDSFAKDDLRFGLYIICVILIIWIIRRKFNYSVLWIFFVIIVIISYILSYRTCNKRKQMENLVQLSLNKQNPCQSRTPTTLIGRLSKAIFGGSSDKECVNHMMNIHGPQSDICDPLEHLNEFFNNILYKNVILLFENIGNILTHLISKTAFPYNIIVVLIFCFILKDFLISTTKLTFKYIIAQSLFGGSHHQSIKQTKESIETTKDKLPILDAYMNLADQQNSLITNLIENKKPKKTKTKKQKSKVFERIEDLPASESNDSNSENEKAVVEFSNVKLTRSVSTPDIQNLSSFS